MPDHKNILQAINSSALNTSKSKAMFSFNKAERFVPFSESTSNFYEKPSMLAKRATSFGFGVKSELISKYRNFPSPDKYDKKSEFVANHKKGISIGLSRGDCKNVSIFNINKFPAPTDYHVEDKQNLKVYTIRAKVKLPELFPDRKTPGPGQYQSQSMEKDGTIFNSKFKSNICYKIHDQSPKKNQKSQTIHLGPQTYNTVMSSTGKQVLSKKLTEKSFVFDKKERVTFHVNSVSPGPGAYTYFSEFNR